MTDIGRSLEREFAWVERIIETRLSLHFAQATPYSEVREIAPPDLSKDGSAYAELVRQLALTFEQRFILVIALAPQLQPQLLDLLRTKNANVDSYFAEFGGLHTETCFHPTVQTAYFLLAGADLAQRLELSRCFGEGSALRRAHLVECAIDGTGADIDPLLLLHPDCLSRLSSGQPWRPALPAGFPAHRLQTSLEWDDLVLGDGQRDGIAAILTWIGHRDTLLRDWGLANRIRPGYRALFRGPSGTGKTLAAALLGKASGLAVYRVDLSAVVSTCTDETANKLARIFEQAESENAILLFDEADALFSRRSEIKDAHDRYANAQASWLLQRMEDFAGTVIIATTLKGDLDEALARRFESIVCFPLPAMAQRLRLWRQAFASCALAPDIQFERIAEEFEISGGAIANVLRHACLMAIRRDDRTVQLADLRHAAAAELRKRAEAA